MRVPLLSRNGTVGRPQVTPLSAWWWMAAAALAVAAAIWATASWLLHDLQGISGNLDQAKTRIEAVRTALAAGAGAGAAIGLLLAFRRQQHQEVATALVDLDATEKRITELYGKAVEQLGSDKAAVRLGGLYALERLAQANPEHQQTDHRQTIANVICAYLRMPFPRETELQRPTSVLEQPGGLAQQTDPRTEVAPHYWTREAWVQEREVRLTAQDILARHLACPDGRQAPVGYWPVTLNLARAHLINASFSSCRLLKAKFTGATFSGNTDFTGATFIGDAWFEEATFIGHSSFRNATFNGDAEFRGGTFTGEIAFANATFSGNTEFSNVTFSEAAGFGCAAFSGYADFSNTAFLGGAWFELATFAGVTHFQKATFSRNHARFDGAAFSRSVSFQQAIFKRDARFQDAIFSDIAQFEDVTFAGAALFQRVTFTGVAQFRRATFAVIALFTDAAFSERPVLAGAELADPTQAHAWPTGWRIQTSQDDTTALVEIPDGEA